MYQLVENRFQKYTNSFNHKLKNKNATKARTTKTHRFKLNNYLLNVVCNKNMLLFINIL